MPPRAFSLTRPQPGNLLSFAFAPEWLALAAIALIDAIWARHTGFHLRVSWLDARVPGTVLAAMIALRLFARWRGGLMAEFLALTLAMAAVFTVFSYLCMAASGPLVDRQLLALDRALGFDWLAGWRLMNAHPPVMRAMQLLYDSLPYQALYLCLLLGLMARVAAMREVFWIIFLSALATNLLAIALPAYGPFEIFGLSSHGGFLPDMKHLKHGGGMDFALSKMTGVICFPSFHTVMALGYAYGLRRTGVIGHTVGAVNIAMLLGVPFIGGHYAIDLIAGCAVFAAATLGVRALLSRRIVAGDDAFDGIALPPPEPAEKTA